MALPKLPDPVKEAVERIGEKVESAFEELLRRNPTKESEFQRLLRQDKPKAKPGTKPDAGKARPPTKDETDELNENFDSTKVLTFGAAMECVVAVLKHSAFFGPYFDQPEAKRTPRETTDAIQTWLFDLTDELLAGQSAETQIDRIAIKMKRVLLSQSRPRVYATKSGRFRV